VSLSAHTLLSEGGGEGGRKGGREGRREEGREEGRKGGREGGREGEREEGNEEGRGESRLKDSSSIYEYFLYTLPSLPTFPPSVPPSLPPSFLYLHQSQGVLCSSASGGKTILQ